MMGIEMMSNLVNSDPIAKNIFSHKRLTAKFSSLVNNSICKELKENDKEAKCKRLSLSEIAEHMNEEDSYGIKSIMLSAKMTEEMGKELNKKCNHIASLPATSYKDISAKPNGMAKYLCDKELPDPSFHVMKNYIIRRYGFIQKTHDIILNEQRSYTSEFF